MTLICVISINIMWVTTQETVTSSQANFHNLITSWAFCVTKCAWPRNSVKANGHYPTKRLSSERISQALQYWMVSQYLSFHTLDLRKVLKSLSILSYPRCPLLPFQYNWRTCFPASHPSSQITTGPRNNEENVERPVAFSSFIDSLFHTWESLLRDLWVQYIKRRAFMSCLSSTRSTRQQIYKCKLNYARNGHLFTQQVTHSCAVSCDLPTPNICYL